MWLQLWRVFVGLSGHQISTVLLAYTESAVLQQIGHWHLVVMNHLHQHTPSSRGRRAFLAMSAARQAA